MDREQTKRAIAQALKTVREEKGYTQGDAAKALGHSQPTISQWENAHRTPDAVDLANLAEVYKISPAEFYGEVFADARKQDALTQLESALNQARKIVRDERKRSRPEE